MVRCVGGVVARVFFFQAEDGIRDLTVTGVQTCALPIYGMFGGVGSLRSGIGDTALGTAWTVQLGYFPSQELGILASVFFGWRDNQYKIGRASCRGRV